MLVTWPVYFFHLTGHYLLIWCTCLFFSPYPLLFIYQVHLLTLSALPATIYLSDAPVYSFHLTSHYLFIWSTCLFFQPYPLLYIYFMTIYIEWYDINGNRNSKMCTHFWLKLQLYLRVVKIVKRINVHICLKTLKT